MLRHPCILGGPQRQARGAKSDVVPNKGEQNQVVTSLWVTLIPNSASNANSMCMLNVHLMVRVSSVLNPYARLALPLPKLVHSTLHGNQGAPS